MNRDAGFRIVADGRDADAADLEIGAVEISLGVADVRGAEDEILKFADLVRLQILRGECRNGDWHRLDVFRPLLGGHHDFLDLRARGRDERGCQEQRACQRKGPAGPNL